jgi:mxaJ protein
MFSATRVLLLYPVLLTTLCAGSATLRICADPNALPYSNQQEQGFENELARMIANDLSRSVSYTWLAQREAFFDKTLNAGLCDVVMGVPAGMSGVATTRPYYRSGYVFVSRRDRKLDIHSLDDHRLRTLRIGVNTLGDNDGEVPPVHALLTRGIVRNLVSYNIFGTLEEANPASRLVTAVARGDVDLAVAWGPIAGYFARDSSEVLRLVAIAMQTGDPEGVHHVSRAQLDIYGSVQIRGTLAGGRVAPDLTHVGGRKKLAANSFPNNDAYLEAWVTHAQSLKPAALMPDLTQFTGEHLRDLVAYLRQLQ